MALKTFDKLEISTVL